MVWESIKGLFGRKRRDAAEAPDVHWLQPAENSWSVSVLDVRPVTLTMQSLSEDRRCAENAISFGREDGTVFVGQRPQSDRRTKASLRFPTERRLLDGSLFLPREMEHKWALFYYERQIICVRSWQRLVHAVARVEEGEDYIEVSSIEGAFLGEDEEPAFTVRVLDYLIRSHALGLAYPAPIPAELEKDPKAAALWCMSAFGNLALFATAHEVPWSAPGKPLRANSLLHVNVARGELAAVDARLAAGDPIDLLANDGLAPLHWAMARPDLAMAELLLNRGSPIDVRSEEGATPLMNAVQAGDVDKAVFLLERGADPNAVDKRGFTALHRAAELGNIDLVRVLLDRGARSSPEVEGHTPKSLAAARGHEAIASLLRQFE